MAVTSVTGERRDIRGTARRTECGSRGTEHMWHGRSGTDATRGVDNPYLPLKDLATYAGLSVRTLRNYLVHRATPLPHYRIGGKLLVRRSDYDFWVAQFRSNVVAGVDQIVDDVLRSLK